MFDLFQEIVHRTDHYLATSKKLRTTSRKLRATSKKSRENISNYPEIAYSDEKRIYLKKRLKTIKNDKT